MPPHAVKMAPPGYGKHSAPDQLPQGERDFEHLPAREAIIAALIDKLPDGAAIDAKTLAGSQPLYGQQAILSALRNLSATGHLYRVRDNAGVGQVRWVQRTYFSRTARGKGWWADFLATRRIGSAQSEPTPAPPKGIHPKERGARRPKPHRPSHPSSPPGPGPSRRPGQRSTPRRIQQSVPATFSQPAGPSSSQLAASSRPARSADPARPTEAARPARPARSEAFEALASLGRADTRLLLSAAECAALEGLAAEWLACGVDRRQFTAVLTAGLPETVHCAGAFVRKRLIAKMPPAPVQTGGNTLNGQPEPVIIRIMECFVCGVPGRPEHLSGGLCHDCWKEAPSGEPDTFLSAQTLGNRIHRMPVSPEPFIPEPLSPEAVHAHAERIRTAVRLARSTRGRDTPAADR
ncbi:MarR family transcriptional regulator [Kitasatospora sp. NPDC001175]|uniref:MarR family transcriptional regulator n=1 Tax=Kitasatospora sp. NPDC001175 TaxID=3157103 RepID=UPI003D048260